MKQVFLEKYQEYCNTKDKREEIFKMVQRDDESLEDFVEMLLYNVQRDGQTDMGLYVLKIILLHGIREYFLDMLNLLGKGDISKESFEKIVELCKRYSRGSSRNNKRDKRDKLESDVFDRTQKSSNGGAIRAEIGNLLENFKIEMMSSISSEIDVLREKQKQVVEDLTLAVFCHRCRKNHPLKECLLDKVEVCQLCELNHETK